MRVIADVTATMKHSDFSIGQEFRCGGKRWRCTDVGTRVVVAISLEPHEVVSVVTGETPGEIRREARSVTNDPRWHTGPPYAVVESVFDEYDMPACSLAEAEADA